MGIFFVRIFYFHYIQFLRQRVERRISKRYT